MAESALLGLVLLALTGLAAGSLATMGVHRLADPSVRLLRPGPRCHRCEAALGPAELVPVLSWLHQRGRCRHCDGSIGWAYPAVELVTAGLFVLVGWRLPEAVDLVPALVLVWVVVVASVTDLYVYLIPNRLVYPAVAVSAAVMIPLAVADGSSQRLRYAAFGLALYFGLMVVTHLVYPAGMGFGDVKLTMVLGLHLGYAAAGLRETFTSVIWALLVGCLLGAVLGGALQLLRRAGIDPLPDPLAEAPASTGDEAGAVRPGFPFGPALAAGCLLLLLFPAVFLPS